MALLSKVFGRPKMTYKGVSAQPPISECCVTHPLMPRWRGPQVMEDDSQAMGFVCHECGREYLPDDVQNRRLIRGAAMPAAHAAPAAPASHDEDDAHGADTEEH